METNSINKTPKVRAAIVGLGMGKYHIADYRKHSLCEVVAICDIDEKKVQTIKTELGIGKGFEDYKDLIDWGKFDVVSLALPNYLHEKVTIEFLNAGYHVLAEKPLALNAIQGKKIAIAVVKNKRKLAMHMNQRMCPEHQLIHRALKAGDLGEVYYVRSGWMRKRGIPVGAAGWFYQKNRAGGGPLIDLGVHMLDSALYCCGFPKVLGVTGQIRQVFADRDIGKGGMDVEDFATAYIRCQGNLTITLEVSWASFHSNLQEAYIHVYGTEAGAHRSTVFAPDWTPTTKFHFSRRSHGAITRELVEEMPVDFPTVQEDLIQAIIDDREPICTVDQGLVVMRVLDAIYESAANEREVRLDS